MSAKQTILHGQGPANLSLDIFVCSFDVCRASLPFPPINYGRVLPSSSCNWFQHHKLDISLVYSCTLLPSDDQDDLFLSATHNPHEHNELSRIHMWLYGPKKKR